MFQLLLIIIYFAFISLGLPDGLLGSAWPTMNAEFNVPFSYAGIISMIIAGGTIISSLQSDRLTKKFGTGKITAISVATTAFALIGFSISRSFPLLCLFAIPYGLGAGAVDASLNNYVALNYKSRHMSWLHCMWGVGATTGPYIMGLMLSRNLGWNSGYYLIAIIQIVLSAILFISLPLWKKQGKIHTESTSTSITTTNPLSLKEIFKIPGSKSVMLCFFCYCALEQTTGLWASSYLSFSKGISVEKAATFAGMFFIGITVGRAISGFITIKLNDKNMIRIGSIIILLGILIMLLPLSQNFALVGLITIGLGCAPIYP